MIGLAPLDVRLKSGRIVQPDLFVCLAGYPLDRAPLDVVPELTIEVLSAQPTYDRFAKRLIYAEAGVREYWLVDPYRHVLEQVRGLETVGVHRETFESLSASGLEIDLKTVFAGLASPH